MIARPLTLAQLQETEWKLIHAVSTTTLTLKYFAADGVPIVACHAKRGARPTEITYIVGGRRAASPAQAVQLSNLRLRKIRSGLEPAPGK